MAVQSEDVQSEPVDLRKQWLVGTRYGSTPGRLCLAESCRIEGGLVFFYNQPSWSDPKQTVLIYCPRPGDQIFVEEDD